jgi:hypothetical protein
MLNGSQVDEMSAAFACNLLLLKAEGLTCKSPGQRPGLLIFPLKQQPEGLRYSAALLDKLSKNQGHRYSVNYASFRWHSVANVEWISN